MINKKIKLHNQEYILKIKYTNIKGISIRINLSNEILVYANHKFTTEFILEQIINNEEQIVRKIIKIHDQISFLEFEKCLNDQKIWIFGKLYDVVFKDQIEKFEINSSSLTVYVPTKFKKDKQYLKLIRTTLVNEIKILFDEAMLRFERIPSSINLQFKDYRSRWGVCYFRDQKIILNERLMHLPFKLINAIIIHELVHLFVPNHGKLFYQELLKYLPNYRALKKQINYYQPLLDKSY